MVGEGFIEIRKGQYINMNSVRFIEVASGGVRVTWSNGDTEFIEKSEEVFRWLKTKIAA